jgi:class 3 adenylate cyclase
VNIASRIQAEMAPGQIGISEVVYNNVRNQAGVVATRIGERSLKNIPEPVVLYAVEV